MPGRARPFALVLCLLVLTLFACDSGPVPPAPTPTVFAEPTISAPDDLATAAAALPTDTPEPAAPLSNEERVLIYKLAVDSLASTEKTNPVFISPYIGEGERLDEHPSGKQPPQALLPALRNAGAGRRYELAEFADSVGSLDRGGLVKDGGVFVTLGEIMPSGRGNEVVLRGTIYRKVGNAAGYTYSFTRDGSLPSGWKLSGTKVEWSDEGGGRPWGN